MLFREERWNTMNQKTKKTVAITVAVLMILGLFSSIISAFAGM